MQKFAPSKNGFSLVELLVVIAVMAVLTLLIAAQLKSKKVAERISCASNLRQLGTALTLYASGEGKYPVGIDRPTGYSWIWPALLREFLGVGKGVELFKCPTAPDEAQWVVSFGSGLPAGDGYAADENRLRPGGQHFMSYGYNVWGAFDASGVNFEGLGVYKGDFYRGAAKVAAVAHPSAMIALGDSNWDLTQKGDRNWSGFIGMYAERQWPLELHQGRANLVFCDGHVESLPRRKFISQVAETQEEQHYCEKRWNRSHQAHRF